MERDGERQPRACARGCRAAGIQLTQLPCPANEGCPWAEPARWALGCFCGVQQWQAHLSSARSTGVFPHNLLCARSYKEAWKAFFVGSLCYPKILRREGTSWYCKDISVPLWSLHAACCHTFQWQAPVKWKPVGIWASVAGEVTW